MYRTLEASYRSIGSVEIDQSVVQLELLEGEFVIGGDQASEASIGRTVRATFDTDSGMFPAKYSGIVAGVPEVARHVDELPFFYAWPIVSPGVSIPVRYKDVEANRTIREGMRVEAELVIVARGQFSTSGLWFEARRVKVFEPE